MASAVDRIVSACEGAGALDRAIEAVVGSIGRLSGKNATSYLEAYQAEMVMRDIPEYRRLSGFPRVATPGVHAEVLEVRDESGSCEEFESWLLEKYGHEDTSPVEAQLHGVGGHPGKGGVRRRSSGSSKIALRGCQR
jgi:hypothetical protein